MKVNNIEVTLVDINACPLFAGGVRSLFTENYVSTQLKRLNTEKPLIPKEEILATDLVAFLKNFSIQAPKITKLEVVEEKEDENDNHGTGKPIENTIDVEEEKGRITLTVPSDCLTAEITMHPRERGEKRMTREELYSYLERKGIVYGLNKEYIHRLAYRPVYEVPFVIASGKQPVLGVDGTVKCFFDTENKFNAELDENGNVDFKNIQTGKTATAGQLLCEIIPPVKSLKGKNVYGGVVVAPSVKPARISAGQNTTFSEDGTQIYADCDGQITYKSDKISVNKELSVKNVNNETGNLDFAGNISIQGDVYTGFTVKSGGNITIGGNVEGATIIAEGNIVIRKGINGSDGGSAVSGGSFTSKFIENATVTAVDSIQAEAVLNSRLTCDGSVTLSGRRGCLIGGDCRAGTQISAKEIGNDANIETKVSVDILPKLKKELEELDIQVAQCEQVKEHLAELYGNLYQPEEKNESKLAALLELAFLYCRVQVEATPVYNRREVISNKINNLTSGSIVVKGSIYQNVIIDINGCIAKTNDTKQFCHIHTKDDEIVYGLANSSI